MNCDHPIKNVLFCAAGGAFVTAVALSMGGGFETYCILPSAAYLFFCSGFFAARMGRE